MNIKISDYFSVDLSLCNCVPIDFGVFWPVSDWYGLWVKNRFSHCLCPGGSPNQSLFLRYEKEKGLRAVYALTLEVHAPPLGVFKPLSPKRAIPHPIAIKIRGLGNVIFCGRIPVKCITYVDLQTRCRYRLKSRFYFHFLNYCKILPYRINGN